MIFNLSNTLKQPSLFSSYSFIESIDISNVLMEGAFPSGGCLTLEREFSLMRTLTWRLNPEVKEILTFIHSQHGPRLPSCERLE